MNAAVARESTTRFAPELIPESAEQRLALARSAWIELQKADADVQRIETMLRSEFQTGRRVDRSDQFAAWERKNSAERLLVACLEPRS